MQENPRAMAACVDILRAGPPKRDGLEDGEPMMNYEQALAIVRQSAPRLPAVPLPTMQSLDRVLAEPVIAHQCLPPFDNAAMDGFALEAGDQGLPAGAVLEVGGRQAAGEACSVARGGAWEIMTGAQLPRGLDAVLPVEQVRVLARSQQGADTIQLLAPVAAGQHVRRRGEDLAAGRMAIAAGTRLRAAQLMLLAALGVPQLWVRRRPRVAVIATGHELVSDPGQPLRSGQIRDSNRPFLAAQLQAAGAEIAWQGTVGDDVAAFQRILDQVLTLGVDMVVSSGAVSMGRHDFVPQALHARAARIGFHKVAVRPGKPLLFAQLPQGPLYFGLPGNPIACAAALRFFVEPALRQMMDLAPEAPLLARLEEGCAKRAPFRCHARAQLYCDQEGQLRVRILSRQEPFRLVPLLAGNAWAVLRAGAAELHVGERVEVYGSGHWQPVHCTAASE